MAFLLSRRLTAGGVVFLHERVLVMRTLRDSWVMPKGGVKTEEAPERAAVREVREESGALVRLVSWVGETTYRIPPEGGSGIVEMTVRWYLMEARSSHLCPEPKFPEAVFLPLEKALRRLSYHTDRGIVQKAAYILRHGPLLPFARCCRPPFRATAACIQESSKGLHEVAVALGGPSPTQLVEVYG